MHRVVLGRLEVVQLGVLAAERHQVRVPALLDDEAIAQDDPQPTEAYAALEKAGAVQLLDAIDDALDALEADSGRRGAPPVLQRWPVGHPG